MLAQDDPLLSAMNDVERTYVKSYLSAQDLTGTPDSAPTRLVLNLSTETDERRVRQELPTLYRHLAQTVKPVRDRLTGQIHQEDFWRFWDLRPSLYAALTQLDRTIVCSRLSRVVMFEMVPTGGVVFSDQVVVIATKAIELLGLLQSSLHSAWIDRYKTGRGGGTRYVVTRCLRTFAFPEDLAALRDDASAYVATRNALRRNHRLSLTKTYNLSG